MVRLWSHHTSRAQRNPVAEHKERQGTVAIFLLKLESGGARNPYQQVRDVKRAVRWSKDIAE